ncbi:hypothetical protein COCCU_03185 [Corynebacterium occultum]|uniref:Uncharacterized protein n=1 Tax=Corynebacterium occultum TaxID=2675219 RepID=A0A6B8W278_9CORY|nr:hypothetical protein [Corynebacterium occultum]QGU06591.1 hypothetical protein COCCU_03185 [Corynebacterium occultum]
MSPTDPQDHSEDRRRKLQLDTLTGFLGFFAFLAVVQAVINIFRPEPLVWPALLALVLVIATVSLWRAGRSRS